jgi:hypothetical protein
MRFYKLDHPNYESDTMYSRRNPITWVHQYIVPGMICPLCGTWAGTRRLFNAVEDDKLKKLLKKKPFPIPIEKWNKLFKNPVNSFSVTPDYQFKPGDELGMPTGKITSNQIQDFIFPWGGGILVTENTKNIFLESKLTGCHFLPMDLIDKRAKKSTERLPVIYVLIVIGRIKPPANINRCPVCGRFSLNYSIELNEENWDGNDFIIDENYAKLVFVTEKACAVFRENDLKNFQCIPI